jgi:hypothetical protein
MSNIPYPKQRGVSISGPTKIVIVWTNQACRTDCDFDSKLVKECTEKSANREIHPAEFAGWRRGGAPSLPTLAAVVGIE